MPVYTFHNKDTDEQWTDTLSIAERDAFLASHPNVQQLIVSAPAFASVERLGIKKPDREFRDMVKYIKKRNPGSTINSD